MAKFNVGDIVRYKDGRGVVRGIQKKYKQGRTVCIS